VPERSNSLWPELALQAPALLACGAALVLALVLIRRQPRQAVLVLLAAALLALAEVVPTVLEHSLLPRDADEVDVERFDRAMRGLAFAAGVARGLAVALFTGAAFLPGRGKRPDRGEDTAARPDAQPGEAESPGVRPEERVR
jgi:hypothetical protein